MSIDAVTSNTSLIPAMDMKGVKMDDTTDEQLKQVSKEFEAVLTTALLKESLKNASKISGDDGDKGSETYKEFAYEQIAHHIGKQGVLGIADQLHQQLSELAGTVKRPKTD